MSRQLFIKTAQEKKGREKDFREVKINGLLFDARGFAWFVCLLLNWRDFERDYCYRIFLYTV